ncbi:ABC transporter ATP-binding protein [Ignatzschineria sp. LJL83]
MSDLLNRQQNDIHQVELKTFTEFATSATSAPLVELQHISKNFGAKKSNWLGNRMIQYGLKKPTKIVSAVNHVDLSIFKGEVVGLVGESGCGKSTLGRVVAGILPQSSGEMLIDGVNVQSMNKDAWRKSQLRIQMIFQDPFASLNPRLRVSSSIGEAAKMHGLVSKKEIDHYVSEQLERAGLSASYRHRFPHQFSGGQRQRIGIARALAVQPDMLVCDEAVAALDVSIQAQIVNLFMDLRDELDLTYLFISHDLGVVEHFSDRVAIMYLGKIVEIATTEEIFAHPNHPYTQALLAEIPKISDRKKQFVAIKGEIPSPINLPTGCYFHPRCPKATEICRQEAPELKEVSPQHQSACHLNDSISI